MKEKTNSNQTIKIKVALDEITQKYATRVTAVALSNSLEDALRLFSNQDDDKANKIFQRTTNRRR